MVSSFVETDGNKRERMLETLNRAAIILLAHEDEAFTEAIAESIRLIAEIADIDRVSITRNIETQNGLHGSQVYRWSMETGTAVDAREELRFSAYGPHISRWAELLAAGECVNGPARLMPENKLLERFGCVSVLAVPCFKEKSFWGFVLFEDLKKERTFCANEVGMLRSASAMLSSVLIRHDEAQKISAADGYANLILQSMPYACTIINRSYQVVDCNEALIKLFRLESKSAFLKNPFMISPETQPDGIASIKKAHEYIAKAFEDGHCSFPWIHITADGEEIPVEAIFVRATHLGEHTLVGFIRDRRRYNMLFREIEERNLLVQTVNSMSAVLFQSELESFESDMNRALGTVAEVIAVDRITVWKNIEKKGARYTFRAFEWCSPNVEPLSATVSITEPNLPRWVETLEKGLYINGPVAEFMNTEKEAMAFHGIKSILVIPIFLKEKFWGFIGFEDCQKRRKFSANEEQILFTASELIADALVRSELEERLHTSAAKLKKALSEAQSANSAKSNFLSHMSHEMRTPMNAIIGMTAIGKSAKTMENKDYAFERVNDASKHLLGVINDVLDMSKIEANKLELSESDFIFEAMLQKVVNVINYRVDERRQSLYVHLDNNIPPSLIGDDQRLSQVISNLLSNACKFSPEGGEIRLSTKLVSEHENMCCIEVCVADNGIGLTSEQAKRVFKAFEQAEAGTSRAYGGTGLGLSISKRIVELMGGKIWVQSEAGHGAAFTFTVQLRRGRALRRKLSEDASWSNIRIFAVDDDADVRRFFLSVAENLGIDCGAAASGEEALRMLEADNAYNICFTSLKLPGMNGIEFAGRVRENMASASMVLLFSSIDWSAIEMDARAAGITRFLSKPLFQSDIVNAIHESIGLEGAVKQFSQSSEVDDFSGHTVLLVEDVDINREIVLALLEPMNLSIECSEDGAEALSMFEAAPDRYDIIFMDVQMPVMDGYEATRRIRALETPRAKDIPIVAMTANVFRDDVERCLSVGMNSHIGKPFLMDEVLEALRKYIGSAPRAV